MARCGCPPDVVTYSTLITGLCWAGRVEEALGVLDLMLEDQCRPNVCTYTPIVHAYCSIGRIEEAKQLVNAMGAVGCPPNTVTYNVIVEALCMVGALDEVGNLINDSVSNGWKPDAITYSIYMDGLCKFGKLDKCVEVFDEMTARGLCPTTVTLNILLDCLCRGSEAWEAKYLLERSRELEWNADVANYNTVMSRLCSGGRVLAVLKLFTDMLKKGIAPNSWTFSIVVNSLCRAGKLRKARCIFDSKGFVANIVTYTTLIRYLHLAGENDEVCLLFYKMVEENISPNHTIYRIMIDCLCTKGRFLVAIGCFFRSLENGYSEDLVVTLTYGLLRGGKLRELLTLLEWILSHGLLINFRIFHALIRMCCKMGFCQSSEIYKVCHILDKMLGVR